MNHKCFNQSMHEYLRKALAQGYHTPAEISRYLEEIPLPGRFARNREERIKALYAVRQAFNEHRHWPLEIIISHLGIDLEQLK